MAKGSEKRRETIVSLLTGQRGPLSAASLASITGVSRQAIVGDIALLRAQGCGIIATARGYMMAEPLPCGFYKGKIACQHSADDTEAELAAIVELGGEVLDVMVTHDIYGDMTGRLNISTKGDVDRFLEKIAGNKAKLLSELTDGVHLHTVVCRDKAAFDNIVSCLRKMGYLYQSE